MGQRKTKIIATVYGTDQDQQRIDTLAERFNKSRAEMLRKLIKEKYENLNDTLHDDGFT